jgi:hypothetical protein
MPAIIFSGFVYAVEARNTMEIEVRPRVGAQARCSGLREAGA